MSPSGGFIHVSGIIYSVYVVDLDTDQSVSGFKLSLSIAALHQLGVQVSLNPFLK